MFTGFYGVHPAVYIMLLQCICNVNKSNGERNSTRLTLKYLIKEYKYSLNYFGDFFTLLALIVNLLDILNGFLLAY